MEALKVLIVDDEAEFADTLAERLLLRNIDAAVTTRGAEALDVIRTQPVDVVILDVKLPGIDGPDVIREIVKIKPGLPVILLTGHGSRDDAEEGTRLGAFAYLLKPVDIESLITVLQRATGRPESEAR